uniref:CRIB domain-containing protein n=1 Tax=Coturnix japonica TaxID=93934 RepID=A0A8C2UFB5_COTJA
MIGEPMNFVHNAHVGIREMSGDFSSVSAHSWVSRDLTSAACIAGRQFELPGVLVCLSLQKCRD